MLRANERPSCSWLGQLGCLVDDDEIEEASDLWKNIDVVDRADPQWRYFEVGGLRSPDASRPLFAVVVQDLGIEGITEIPSPRRHLVEIAEVKSLSAESPHIVAEANDGVEVVPDQLDVEASSLHGTANGSKVGDASSQLVGKVFICSQFFAELVQIDVEALFYSLVVIAQEVTWCGEEVAIDARREFVEIARSLEHGHPCLGVVGGGPMPERLPLGCEFLGSCFECFQQLLECRVELLAAHQPVESLLVAPLRYSCVEALGK